MNLYVKKAIDKWVDNTVFYHLQPILSWRIMPTVLIIGPYRFFFYSSQVTRMNRLIYILSAITIKPNSGFNRFGYVSSQ